MKIHIDPINTTRLDSLKRTREISSWGKRIGGKKYPSSSKENDELSEIILESYKKLEEKQGKIQPSDYFSEDMVNIINKL